MKRMMLSGYKPYELGIFDEKHPGVKVIKLAIKQQLIALIDDGLELVVISGQPGVELWGAEVVLELKKDYPTLKLAVVTPFQEQEGRWKESVKLQYKDILTAADSVKTTSDKPYTGPEQFQKRDQTVLTHTDGLLLLFDDEKGGSPRYLKEKAEKHANKGPFTLITIDAYDLQVIEEDLREQEREEW